MKPAPRRLAALLLAMALAFTLAACGGVTPEDAEGYVRGFLDASYLGQYNDDYLEITGMTAAEAQEQDYAWNTAAEADILMDYLEIYPTEASTAAAIGLVEDIYALSRYEVGDASKLEDGSYAVSVTVYPMDILVRYELQGARLDCWADALAQYGITTQEALDAMSDEAYAEMEDQYAAAVLDGIRAMLPEMGYGPAQSAVIQLKLEDDVYTMVETDWQHFDSMVIDYTAQYCDPDGLVSAAAAA